MLSGITMSREENILGRWILLSCLAMLLCMMGCSGVPYSKAHSRRAIVALMDSAEAVMNDDPGYALQLMDSINPASIPSRALNARYALIYSEVLYKNYIPAQSDSLIMIAVRYYSGSNQPELLFRSYYSLGCIYYDLESLTDAAVVFAQAGQLADKINDDYRLGLLYSKLGDVFFYCYDFNRAEHYYQLSIDYYSQAGKERHMIYGLYSVGGCLMQLNDFYKADSIMNIVKKWAEKNNDTNLLSACLLNNLDCSLNLKDINKADIEISQYVELFGFPQKKTSSICKFAHYYILKNDLATARELLDKAWSISNSSDSVQLLYVESLLNEKTGRTETAISKYKQSIIIQNTGLRYLLSQPILGAQNDYFKSLSEIESLKLSRSRNVIIFLLTILFFVLVIARIVVHYQKLKNESDRQGYLLTIKELRLKEDSNNDTINKLNKSVNTLFYKQYSELDDIFDRMIEFDIINPNDDTNTTKDIKAINQKYISLFYKQIHAKFEDIKSARNQKELDRIINDTFDNIMISLSDKKLRLSENDLLILRLLIIGFSPKVVSYIVSEQQKIIYQKRTRILKRIEQNEPETAQTLYKILKIK